MIIERFDILSEESSKTPEQHQHSKHSYGSRLNEPDKSSDCIGLRHLKEPLPELVEI